MYEEVREHLKEMLEIDAIWPSHSPSASPVVLVCKKEDSKLWFCIDLRKLNVCTTKDSYSLPRIEDTVDSLNGLFGSQHWILNQDIGKWRWMRHPSH